MGSAFEGQGPALAIGSDPAVTVGNLTADDGGVDRRAQRQTLKGCPTAFGPGGLIGNVDGLVEIYQHQIRPVTLADKAPVFDRKEAGHGMAGFFDNERQ